MKKNVFFLAIPLIITGCLIACEDYDPAVIAKYTIEATAGEGGIIRPSGEMEVVSGENVNFSFKADAGFKIDSITINGIISSLTTNWYTLLNVTSNYKIKVTFKKTLSWYLILGPWMRDSIIIRENNGSWSHYALWGVPGELQEVVTFLPNGRITLYWNGVKVGDAKWSIDETTNPPTLNCGGIWTLETLSEISLIIVKDDVKYIYSHH